MPFTAGSATDVIARIVSPKMVERWGKQVVTDNRPSAGGIVACSIVAEAAGDGHTLLVTGSNFAGSAALYSKLPFDAVKDFSGITQFASTPLVLVVASNLGVKTVKELIALAREKPGQLNYASTGLGSGPALRRGALQDGGRHQGRARAVPGLAGNAHRSHGRTRAVHPLARPGGLAARQERQGPGAGSDDHLPRAGAA